MIEHFKNVREITEQLVAPLEIEDFTAQPIVDVSPPKWHLGHTTWFFENFILVPYFPNYQLFNPSFAFIFNSYYESQGQRILRNKRGTLTRPSTEKILEYRKYVNNNMVELLSSNSTEKELLRFLEIGIHHEQQHQELLITDIKYILGSNPIAPKYSTFNCRQDIQSHKSEWLPIKEGNYSVGYSGDEFHFDNEKGAHTVYLHAYAISNRLVTNEEFLQFMEDGGYSKPEYWLMEGWEWVKEEQAVAPLYWFQNDGQWMNYQLNGIKKVDLSAPLTHVNFYEAEAFARWKNCRLLTEQEWEVASIIYGDLKAGHFQELSIFHPQSSNSNQLFGTVWEWTNSAYLPYPYYQQEKGALGEYNGKFMINQMVLRGGSCATPQSHFRPTYRNFFHPNLQWQFTGIRLAKNL